MDAFQSEPSSIHDVQIISLTLCPCLLSSAARERFSQEVPRWSIMAVQIRESLLASCFGSHLSMMPSDMLEVL